MTADNKNTPVPEPKYTRVLVFMDVSTPDLVPAAAAAIETVTSELRRLGEQPGQRELAPRLFVRVLVHGYQTQGLTEIGSRTIEYNRAPGISALQWTSGPVKDEAPYAPADPTALAEFVQQSLRETPPGAPPATHDFGAVLFLWGHGQGVGTRLQYPRGVDAAAAAARLPASVDRPSLLNVGGLDERSVAEALEHVLERVSTPARRLDLVVLDSCLMAAAELAFEFRRVARFMIASQTFVSRPGMNLGRSIVHYLKEAHADKQGQDAPRDPVLEGAKAIVHLAGALRSGASHLTLFRLSRPTALAPTERRLAGWLLRSLDHVRQPGPPCTCTCRGDCSCEARNEREREHRDTYEAPDIQAPIMHFAHDDEFWSAFNDYPWFRVFCAFSQLVQLASADADEHARILVAFRRAHYVQARQFLDLKDLARQVHRYSRHKGLQIVALELMRELEEEDEQRQDGLVVLWRAVIEEQAKNNYSGVSIYCPWFEAEGPDDYDALVDHRAYRHLDLPRMTGWAGFVLGPMQRLAAPPRQDDCVPWDEHLRAMTTLKHLMHGADHGCGGPGPGGASARGLGKGSGPQADGAKGSGPQAGFD